MGQSQPFKQSVGIGAEAFRDIVLQGASHLSREQIRGLADELHELARMMGPADDFEALRDDGNAIWV